MPPEFQGFDVTIKGYRAFPREAPITFRIERGITFLLGLNNVGKSAIVRMFYELRGAFERGAWLRARAQGASPQDYGFSLNTLLLTFDRLANRVTPRGPMEIAFQQNGVGWRVAIRPNGDDPHTESLVGSASAIGAPSEALLDQIGALFNDSMYVGSFRSAGVETSGALYDVQIGKSFISQWDSWANGQRIEHSLQVDKLVEELGGLFGYRKFGVSVSSHRDQLFLTTDDGRFALSELGDGISHYVVVLGNAMIRRPGFIFIDEPEIGLHPRMQEVFVRTLASKAKTGLIATSHSVGLARSVADKIFSVARDSDGRKRCVLFGGERRETLLQTISELGYSQFAELGANHLLLVEGKTDTKVFREVLRKFKLDQHFLVQPLNGSSSLKDATETAKEIQELKRLNPESISVIFDSERTSGAMDMAPELKPFAEMCSALGVNVFATDRHSTENYIIQAALDVVAPGHKQLGPFEKFGANGHRPWGKSQNWLMFERMTAADLDGTKLKEFVDVTLRGLVDAN